jgi:ATP-binding cassette, subfamily B, bacterial
MMALDQCRWPMTRAGEALEALARAARFESRAGDVLEAPPDFGGLDVQAQTRWLDAAAGRAGLEVEAVSATPEQAGALVAAAGPALITAGDVSGLFLLLRGNNRRAVVIGPDHRVRRVDVAELVATLAAPLEASVQPSLEPILRGIDAPPAMQARLRAALVRERMALATIVRGWILREPPARPGRTAVPPSLWTGLLRTLAARGSGYGLWILSWWMLGTATLEGRVDRGWLLAWALLVATAMALDLLATSIQGRLSVTIGSWLKQHLLDGTLKLEPDEVSRHGSGRSLGQVVEAQSVDALILTGGFLALTASLEFVAAGIVLSFAAAWLAAALLLCVTAVGLLAWRFVVARETWTQRRLALTDNLVESLLGHRTRVAQQMPRDWHGREDLLLAGYIDASSAMDAAAIPVLALASRAWLLISVSIVGVLFTAGVPDRTLALSLGGVLLAQRAFRRLSGGIGHVATALVAWREAAPIRRAARRTPGVGVGPVQVEARSDAAGRSTVLEASGVSFTHAGRAQSACETAVLSCRRTVESHSRDRVGAASPRWSRSWPGYALPRAA